MGKSYNLTSGPDVDWSGFSVLEFYKAIAEVVAAKENVKIEVEVVKKDKKEGGE